MPDLTQCPPRSPRCPESFRGYAILPRLFDKGRATDQQVINFLGLDVAALREQLAAGKGDGEILEWVNANAKHKRSAWEIEQWSDFMQRRSPAGDVETLQFFTGAVGNFRHHA
jgi:hypothetical protein